MFYKHLFVISKSVTKFCFFFFLINRLFCKANNCWDSLFLSISLDFMWAIPPFPSHLSSLIVQKIVILVKLIVKCFYYFINTIIIIFLNERTFKRLSNH